VDEEPGSLSLTLGLREVASLSLPSERVVAHVGLCLGIEFAFLTLPGRPGRTGSCVRIFPGLAEAEKVACPGPSSTAVLFQSDTPTSFVGSPGICSGLRICGSTALCQAQPCPKEALSITARRRPFWA
jgi:hypothetical protein